MTSPSPDEFRAVMSRFATGVTVMTTHAEGLPHGMTANAVASVSLDPLLVLVCVERDTVMVDAVAESGVFAFSILGADDAPWSERFADPDRPVGDAQFDGVGHRAGVTGAPILTDAVAWLECEDWATYDGGDHVIVVGQVVALGLGTDAAPLLYHRSGYTTVADRGLGRR